MGVTMQKQILKLTANILALYIASIAFPAIHIDTTLAILSFGIILWLVNMIIRPLILIVSIPISLITFGLFSLVINTWMVLLADFISSGVDIPGFWLAFAVALFVSVANMLFEGATKK